MGRPRGFGTDDLAHARVREIARRSPHAPAVADGTFALTYGALDAVSDALAHRLRALGVRPGVRVGLCHDRASVTVVAALAVLKAGGAYVGLDPLHPKARLELMLRDAAAPVLLTQRSVSERLGGVCDEVIDLDHDLASLEPSGPVPELAGSTDPAYVIYTSGSTGEPKGVEVSHRSLASLLDWHCRAFELESGDRVSVLASPAFDASVWELWPALSVGAGLHVAGARTVTSPERLRDWIVATGITVSFVPTPLTEVLVQLDWPEETALRLLLTGGDLLKRRPPAGTPFELINNYGVAEATVVSTSGRVAPDHDAGGAPSIGRAIAGARLYVLDEHGEPVGPGEPGELHIGGPGVAIGYLNRPDLTAQRFRLDPFTSEPGARMYRTGDRVRVDPDGDFHFLGRLDDQVQIRGQRVELAEVAAELAAHPCVAQCAVVAREQTPGGVQLVAYFVASHHRVPNGQELRELLSTRLPSFMVPSSFTPVESLPLTSSGKVDRDRLPDPVPDPEERLVALPRTPVEGVIIEILRELLELDRVGPDDNIFEMGGHSLMAAQLVLQLEDELGVQMDLLVVFDHPTAAELAAHIDFDVNDADRSSLERALDG